MSRVAAAGLCFSMMRGQEPAKSSWTDRETRLANEYLSLLVERPEYGRVLELLWALYEKHGSTALLLQNIRAQSAQSNHPAVKLVEAHLLRKSGDLKTAASIYDEVLKVEPKQPVALQARAEVANEMNQPEAAVAFRKRLVESLPDTDASKPSALVELGNLSLAMNQTEAAAAVWEAAAKLKPNDFEFARQIAELLMRAGLPRRAAAFYEKLADQDDPQKKLAALLDLARIHEHADQFAKSDAALVKALGLLHFRDGRYAEFFRRRVRLHERFGVLEDLKNQLLAEGRKSPPSEKALSDLERFSAITVDFDEQVRWLRELVKLSPDSGEYRWLLVRALLDHEGAAEAAKLIDEKLQGDGADMPAVVLLRCEADLRLGKNDEATARLKRLIEAQTPTADTEKQVLAFAQEKALDDIIEMILIARVERQEHKAEAVFELAGFYRSRRKASEMSALFARFVNAAKADDKQRRLNDVAAFLGTGGEVDQAIIAARTALKNEPDGYEEILRLADLLAEQGDNEEARKLLQKAWSQATTHEQRLDVDERVLSLLIGEDAARSSTVSETQSDVFNVPTIFTGAGFASDDDGGRRPKVPMLVADEAWKLRDQVMKDQSTDVARVFQAAWWCHRADLIQEAYDLLRRLAFDPASGQPVALPLEAEKLLLDLAMLDQNTALVRRLLPRLMTADSENEVRYVLRLSETILDAGQRAASVVADSFAQRPGQSEALAPGVTATGEAVFFETSAADVTWKQVSGENSPIREAVALLEAAYRKQPDSEPLLTALTQCDYLLREPEKALARWETAARRADGGNATPLLERYAEMLLKMHRLPEFIAVQVDLVERETDVKRRREIFNRFMDRLMFADASGGDLAPTVMQDRLKMVETALTERVRRHPFDGFYHEALAQVFERGGDAKRAFTEMKQAYYTAPDTPFSLDQLRAAALKTGDLKSAIYFQKQIVATASRKDEMAESRQLVELLEQTFQITEADRVRRRVESRFAQDAKALDDLAGHYQTTGQDDAERRVYEQVVRVRPWDGRARLQLALKCLRLADEEAAERHLRELLKSTASSKPWEKSSVERWPLPLMDEARQTSGSGDPRVSSRGANALSDLAASVESAPGLQKEEAGRLRAFLSFPRPELTALPDDPALVRLRVLAVLGRLVHSRGGDEWKQWIAEWKGQSDASPVEALWALHHAGAHAETRALLRQHLRPLETTDMEFAFVWLSLRSQGMADVLAWTDEQVRKTEVLARRKRLLTAAVAMLADVDSFRFVESELRLLAASHNVRLNVLDDILRKLQDRQRYAEALALGTGLRGGQGGESLMTLHLLARMAEGAEQWDLQRQYLEMIVASPQNPSRSGGLFDPYVNSLSSLRQASGSAASREQVWREAWMQLQKTPESMLTTQRRTVVTGLAGATEQAADELAEFVGGDLIVARELGERQNPLMPQGATRQEEPAHLRGFWEDTRQLGANLNALGLASVSSELDEKLDEKWGGVLLGPRAGFEFSEWRLGLLLRRMRETNYPNRLRLIREHLGPVDMRSEAAVDALTELGAKLLASGMAREAIEIYRRLPARAPTNSDYANSLMQASEAALEIEPGRGFIARLLAAEPHEKPPNIGDETLRERHARLLVMSFDVEELRERAFVEKPTRMLQGRIPPEVPYLRELGLLLERLGDEAGALTAWERLHSSLEANSDAGLEPDAEASLHRGRILQKQGHDEKALAALRGISFRDPLSFAARDVMILRAALAAKVGKWEEFQELMLAAVERKSVEAVIALSGDLEKGARRAEALSFLTQAERTIKDSAARFRLRLEQLRLLCMDGSWKPATDRARISSLLRATTRDRDALQQMMDFLTGISGSGSAGDWIQVLRSEARSGADRPLAALALTAFAKKLPADIAPAEMMSAWRTATEMDRVCLEIGAEALLKAGRPAWAWQTCLAAAEVPILRLNGRKLPVMARIAAAMQDGALVREVFADVMRMPAPGGGQPLEWAQAFEDGGQAALAGELLAAALSVSEARQSPQPEIMKAMARFHIRQKNFAAAEALLLRQHYLFGMDAAKMIVDLYHAWGRLDSIEAELPKYFLPGGVEKEAAYLVSVLRQTAAPKPPP